MAEIARRIAASQLPSKCLALLDEVHQSGHEWIVTRRGQPVAKLVPWQYTRTPNARPSEDFSDLLGSVRYDDEEDLLSPVDAVWEADG